MPRVEEADRARSRSAQRRACERQTAVERADDGGRGEPGTRSAISGEHGRAVSNDGERARVIADRRQLPLERARQHGPPGAAAERAEYPVPLCPRGRTFVENHPGVAGTAADVRQLLRPAAQARAAPSQPAVVGGPNRAAARDPAVPARREALRLHQAGCPRPHPRTPGVAADDEHAVATSCVRWTCAARSRRR